MSGLCFIANYFSMVYLSSSRVRKQNITDGKKKTGWKMTQRRKHFRRSVWDHMQVPIQNPLETARDLRQAMLAFFFFSWQSITLPAPFKKCLLLMHQIMSCIEKRYNITLLSIRSCGFCITRYENIREPGTEHPSNHIETSQQHLSNMVVSFI